MLRKYFIWLVSTNEDRYYHFSADYQPATTDKIQKIHKYLMNKYNIK